MKCQFTDHLQLAYSVCVMIVFPGFIKDRDVDAHWLLTREQLFPVCFFKWVMLRRGLAAVQEQAVMKGLMMALNLFISPHSGK